MNEVLKMWRIGGYDVLPKLVEIHGTHDEEGFRFSGGTHFENREDAIVAWDAALRKSNIYWVHEVEFAENRVKNYRSHRDNSFANYKRFLSAEEEHNKITKSEESE